MLLDYKDVSHGLPPSLSLVGKTAIVTGASRGIGSAIAVVLASRGANIALTYTSESSVSKVKQIASKIEAFGRKTTIIKCDLADENCGKIIVSETLAGLDTNTIDILVNNAAIANPGGPTPVKNGFSAGHFDEIFHINVRAPALLVQAVLEHLPKTGGRIINMFVS